MDFQVVVNRFEKAQVIPSVLLERTTWDDYGYRTLFQAFYAADEARRQALGPVKILEEAQLTPSLPKEPFRTLDASFCSLGQNAQYYIQLANLLGVEQAREALSGLRDLALAPEIPESLRSKPGVGTSLLRFPNAEAAHAEARRLLFGEQRGSIPSKPLEFTFSCKLKGFVDEHRVPISFQGGKNGRLGRIAAIAGRNGTGKTQLVSGLAKVLSGLSDAPEDGRLEPRQRARVVVVSFNPFDRFTVPRNNVPGGDYAYYGLRAPVAHAGGASARAEVNIERAVDRLRGSLEHVWRLGESYQGDWTRFLHGTGVLESEPELIDPFSTPVSDSHEIAGRIDTFVERLKTASSGHQLLVFIITGLVESIRERSLALLDEPEAHLHPRLLSTLLRLLYDFLAQRDAYALIATHSPIVLQELPGRSIALLRTASRSAEGGYLVVKPYPRESFAESLDEIINHAFSVEDADRSYVTILEKFVAEGRTRTEIEQLFDGLGLRARLLLREIVERRGAP